MKTTRELRITRAPWPGRIRFLFFKDCFPSALALRIKFLNMIGTRSCASAADREAGPTTINGGAYA